MSLDAGKLNCFIRIERRDGSKDELNQPFDTWVLVKERWAQPKTSPGMAAVRAAAEGVPVAPNRYSWRIRYCPEGLDTGMRVNYHGTMFGIVDIKHDHAEKQWTDLICDTGGANE